MNQSNSEFDKRAAAWDEDERRVKLATSIVQAIQKAFVFRPDTQVLELGAGTGLVTLALAQSAAHVTAMDGSAGMLDVLRQKLVRLERSNVTPLLADAEAIWPTPGPFDLIAGSMMLHHVKDVDSLFSQSFSALESGGCLVMADLETESGDFHDDNTGVHHFGFDPPNLAHRLAQAGFGDVRFIPACSMSKLRDGVTKEYKVFLFSARKPV